MVEELYDPEVLCRGSFVAAKLIGMLIGCNCYSIVYLDLLYRRC